MEWIRGLGNDLRRMLGGDFSSPLTSGLIDRLVDGIVALALLLGAYFLAKLVSRSISGAICRRVDETLGKFLGRLSF